MACLLTGLLCGACCQAGASTARSTADAAVRPAPLTFPLRSVVLVCPVNRSEPESISLRKLSSRLTYLGLGRPEIATTLPPPCLMDPRKDYIVVGVHRPGAFPAPRALVDKLRSRRRPFEAEQGFVLSASIGPRGQSIIVAAGLRPMGAVYAMAELETRLWTEGGEVRAHLDKPAGVEVPKLKERELYINIGYGLSRRPITPDTWTIAEWKRYIDKLVLAKYTSWSFYLWGNCELAYPRSDVNRERNEALHRVLRQAISYSHARGLKVGCHLSPTMIPEDIWSKHPELQSKLEYTMSGLICPSKPASWPLMTEIHGNEVRWFRDCDFFSIWFYDCGGCFCDECKVPEKQLDTLVEQVRTFDRVIEQHNPAAVRQVMTWGIWRYERMHNYSIRDRFMQRMAELFRGRECKAVFSDGAWIDAGCEPLYTLIRKHGFDAKTFLYQTNIENGQPFAVPLTRYFDKWVPQCAQFGADRAFLMRMECLTKYPQDFVGGLLFWNPDIKGEEALRRYAYYELGDARAGDLAAKALAEMDDFSWFGHSGGKAHTLSGREIARLLNEAVDAVPARRRGDIEWLKTTGEGYRVLGAAVDAKAANDQEALAAQNEEFRRALAESPTFSNQVQSKEWLDLFLRWYVDAFRTGFSQAPF